MAAPKAKFLTSSGQVPYYSATAVTAGTVVQLPDKRAGVVAADIAAESIGMVYTSGLFAVAKANGVVPTAGYRAIWDPTNLTVLVELTAADQYQIGTFVTNPTGWPSHNASADLLCLVDLNATGKTYARAVYDASMDATPGEVNEVAFEVSSGTVWYCTVSSSTAATWVQFDPKD